MPSPEGLKDSEDRATACPVRALSYCILTAPQQGMCLGSTCFTHKETEAQNGHTVNEAEQTSESRSVHSRATISTLQGQPCGPATQSLPSPGQLGVVVVTVLVTRVMAAGSAYCAPLYLTITCQTVSFQRRETETPRG